MKNETKTKIFWFEVAIVLIAAILLSNCDSGSNHVEVEVRETALKNLEVKFLKNVEAVNVKYIEIQQMASSESIKFEKLKYNDSRFGFHVEWHDRTTIYIVRPREISFKDFACYLGHEMSHELFGEFHKPNQKITKMKIKLPE